VDFSLLKEPEIETRPKAKCHITPWKRRPRYAATSQLCFLSRNNKCPSYEGSGSLSNTLWVQTTSRSLHPFLHTSLVCL